MLVDFYYSVWGDCIRKARSVPQNENNWKAMTMIFMSMSMVGNFIIVMIILKKYVFHNDFYNVHVNLFPGENLDNFVDFFILYFAPVLFVNYIFILHNNSYEKILTKYKYYNGKLFASYFVCSLILPLIIIIALYLLQ